MRDRLLAQSGGGVPGSRAGSRQSAVWGSSGRCHPTGWPGCGAGSRASPHCALGAQRRALQRPTARSAAAGRDAQARGSAPRRCCHQVAVPAPLRHYGFWNGSSGWCGALTRETGLPTPCNASQWAGCLSCALNPGVAGVERSRECTPTAGTQTDDLKAKIGIKHPLGGFWCATGDCKHEFLGAPFSLPHLLIILTYSFHLNKFEILSFFPNAAI